MEHLLLKKLTLLPATIITYALMSLTLSSSVNAANTTTPQVSRVAQTTADYAVATYQQDMVKYPLMTTQCMSPSKLN